MTNSQRRGKQSRKKFKHVQTQRRRQCYRCLSYNHTQCSGRHSFLFCVLRLDLHIHSHEVLVFMKPVCITAAILHFQSFATVLVDLSDVPITLIDGFCIDSGILKKNFFCSISVFSLNFMFPFLLSFNLPKAKYKYFLW